MVRIALSPASVSDFSESNLVASAFRAATADGKLVLGFVEMVFRYTDQTVYLWRCHQPHPIPAPSSGENAVTGYSVPDFPPWEIGD